MATALISNNLINKIEIKNRQYDIRDTKLKGFLIGRAGVLTPAQAREKAIKILADDEATLFVAKSKNYLSRYVPLNKTVMTTLKIWLDQTAEINSQYLFPSPTNKAKPVQSVKNA